MKNLKNSVALLLLCIAIAISSCTKAPDNTNEASQIYKNGESVVLADSEGCEYTIVRSDTCDKSIKDVASKLCKEIKKATGNLPKIKTDYGTKIDLEILIGNTNRQNSKDAASGLSEKDFNISFDGAKVAIVGGSDASTVEAVDYFIENYIKEGSLTLICGESYTYTYVAPKIMVGDADLSEFKIYSDGVPNALVERISNAIFASIGKTPELTDKKEGHYISLQVDTDFEIGYFSSKILNDGNIYLEADTATGLYFSVSAFEKELDGKNVPGEVYELALSKTGAYPPAFELFGEDDERYFVCQTNKDALSYEIGEEIIFDIALFANGELSSCARFDWSIVGDDGQSSSGSELGATGTLSLKTSLQNNGFVMVTVKAMGADGKEIDEEIRFSGAAGVHPELLTITKEEPSDFDEYWEKAIEELDGVAPEIIEMEEIKGNSGYKAYKMKIACAGNTKWTGETYLAGYLTYPSNASPKSLKIQARFQGYGVNSTKPSYSGSHIVFTVCAHSIEQGEEDSYYNSLKSNELNKYGWYASENADPMNVYYRYMLLRDLQALRFMKEYFGSSGLNLWDGDTIELTGSSQGGFQVIALAALDKDVDYISAGVPWLCDIGASTDGKRIKSTFRPDFAEGLGYFDTASFAARIKCTVSISAGLGDTLCPPAGVAAMYNALNCPKSITFGQNRTHSYNPPVGDKIVFSEG